MHVVIQLAMDLFMVVLARWCGSEDLHEVIVSGRMDAKKRVGYMLLTTMEKQIYG